MNEHSCVGCKFLYGEGDGYSNYTWLDTSIRCAKDLNPHLPADKPSDWLEGLPSDTWEWEMAPHDVSDQWRMQHFSDNWPLTNNSRCSSFAPGPYVELDVDGDNFPSEFTDDWEAIEAISVHAGRATSQAAKTALDVLNIEGE